MDVVRRFIPCVHEDLVDSEFHDEMIDEQPQNHLYQVVGMQMTP